MEAQNQTFILISHFTDRELARCSEWKPPCISLTEWLFWYSYYMWYVSVKILDKKKWVKTVDKQKDEIGKGNHKMSSGDSRVGAEWFMSLVTQSHTRVTGHHDIYRIHHERTPESRALSILQSVSSRLWALSLYLLFLINWLRALIYLSLQNRCFPVFSYYLCLGKWPENIFLWSSCVVSSYYSTEEIIIKGELMWG